MMRSGRCWARPASGLSVGVPQQCGNSVFLGNSGAFTISNEDSAVFLEVINYC